MGRRKIEIRPIEDDRNRTVTFLKRKAGLFKKAHELSVLCQVDLAVIIFGQNKKLYQFSSIDSDDIIERYQHTSKKQECKGPADYGDYPDQSSYTLHNVKENSAEASDTEEPNDSRNEESLSVVSEEEEEEVPQRKRHKRDTSRSAIPPEVDSRMHSRSRSVAKRRSVAQDSVPLQYHSSAPPFQSAFQSTATPSPSFSGSSSGNHPASQSGFRPSLKVHIPSSSKAREVDQEVQDSGRTVTADDSDKNPKLQSQIESHESTPKVTPPLPEAMQNGHFIIPQNSPSLYAHHHERPPREEQQMEEIPTQPSYRQYQPAQPYNNSGVGYSAGMPSAGFFNRFSNLGERTPVSGLPSRYVNDLLPSPSNFYPADWSAPFGNTPVNMANSNAQYGRSMNTTMDSDTSGEARPGFNQTRSGNQMLPSPLQMLGPMFNVDGQVGNYEKDEPTWMSRSIMVKDMIYRTPTLLYFYSSKRDLLHRP